MGIYDRDYARREGSGFLGSIGDRGTVCLWLIGITVGVFIIQVLTTPAGKLGPFTPLFLLQPERVFEGQVWRLATYAFLHWPNQIVTIVFSMLFLWWFGRDMEEMYGPREFLAYYLAVVLLGGVGFVLTALLCRAPLELPYLGSGSAGPVAAVLVLCACYYPRRIILLFFILPVPIWLVVVLLVAINAYSFLAGLAGLQQGFGATAAQVAPTLTACLFALAYYKWQWRVTSWWPDLQGLRRRLRRPPLRVYREEEPPTPVRVGAPLPPAEDEQLEAKMDAILEKISRTGKESLTDSERQVLLRASEIYKRRRS
jgi:membrane associated rhomboid family serine protease